MDKYIGRENRLPKRYNTNFLSLEEFASHYSHVVDGDTIRLKGKLAQRGSDDWGYRLWLTADGDKKNLMGKTVHAIVFNDQPEILLKESMNCDRWSPQRNTPYFTEERYDTIRNKDLDIEGIIYFCKEPSSGECAEYCFLYIGDWENFLPYILNQ